ncbi:hypothetical protein SAMN05660242_2863 [Thermoanaerobacterium sp. RBIITD]|nr:hypothetical protein SAMN05660242_2863 [Thermoanaerobacterium sp. RBIITD]
MNYLNIEIVNNTNEHIFFDSTKECNAKTCIHNCNSHCMAFKDQNCDFFENMLYQEQ